MSCVFLIPKCFQTPVISESQRSEKLQHLTNFCLIAAICKTTDLNCGIHFLSSKCYRKAKAKNQKKGSEERPQVADAYATPFSAKGLMYAM